MIRKICASALLTPFLILAPFAQATIVEFETNVGNFSVNLYDQGTPETVNNFLSYVTSEDYDNTIVHRADNGFVIQGGEYIYDGTLPLGQVTAGASVVNEPEYSNRRGTIAMAKIGGNANSATNQWFVNLANNHTNLDTANGGFTVFGEVIGDGMTVVDLIASTSIFNKGGALNELPLRNYTTTDDMNSVAADADNFIVITSVRVTDATVDSAATLSPVENTLIDRPTSTPSSSSGSGGGGGPMGLWVFVIAGILLIKKRLK